MKKFLAIVLSALLCFAMFGCGAKTESDSIKSDETKKNEVTQTEHQKVKVTVKKFGEFVIELYPEYAPETCKNFLELVNKGFYDGLTFHRVIKGFMAQGGDPDGTGNGGSGKTIKGEFAANGYDYNKLSHQRGVISMARSADNDSASSQFFICYADCSAGLDGEYAAFGKVISGMETLDKFTTVEMGKNQMGEKASPKTPIVIDKMEVVK